MGHSTSEKPRFSPLSLVDPDDDEEVTSITNLGEIAQRSAPKLRDRATLTMVTGAQAGLVFTLAAGETLVGRSKECAIRIDDGGISRRHARILPDGPDHWILEDLESRNGTTVNGAPALRHRLADGDRIGLGPSVELRFAITDEAEEELLRRLYESAVSDALTGCFNRKHFGERLASELAYAKRHSTPLSLVMFDLDHFKRVNDTLGHLAGDHVLRTVAGLLKRTLRAEDVLARYGGEEFAVIARGIDVAQAVMLGERLRTTVERARIQYGADVIPVTVSVGVASLACCTRGGSLEEIVHVADTRLYEAKHGGRNRTIGP